MQWAIQGDELVKVSDDGTKVLVPASEIYALSLSAQELLPSLSFSRFPAQIFVQITPTSEPLSPKIAFIAVSHSDEVEIEIADIANRKSDHITDGIKWYPLEKNSFDSIKALLSETGIGKSGVITLREYLELIRRKSDYDVSIEDRWGGEAITASKAESAYTFEIPKLQANLYPYQIQGAGWLLKIASQGIGCILADEMGLGKTLQIIALLAGEKASGNGPNLVVCPATLLENWRREVEKFCPYLNVFVHQGTGRTGSSSLLKSADIVVTSYDTCVRDYLLLEAVSWNCIILDEAQAIKNPDAKRTSAVKMLPRRIAVAVTGTPVENRLEDLWSIVDFVLPGMLGDRSDFVLHFDNTVTNAQRLGPIVSPILLRRRLSDVAEALPPRINVPQALRVPKALAQAYNEIRKAALSEYGKAGGLAALIRLRLFCAHPSLVGGEAVDLAEGFPKYQRLLELLEEIFSAGQKVLIFSNFNGMTDLLVADLPRRFQGIYVDWIDGRVNVRDRQPKIDAFSDSLLPGALILSPRAAGSGLNITAANHVIHYCPEWNPAIEDQASARAHRRGQRLPVTVHRLFYLGTVEEVMVDRLSLKREIADGAVIGNRGDFDARDIMRALNLSPLGDIQ